MTVDDVVVAIQRAARGVSPHSLFVTAAGDGVVVTKPRGGEVPLAQAYGTAEALVAAIGRAEPGAVGAALRGLACLDADAVRDVALALAGLREAAPELRRAAMFALARSRSDAALDALVAALDGEPDVPCAALARSVHPAASARARAALAASGAEACTPLPAAASARAARAAAVLAARGDRSSIAGIAALLAAHPDASLRVACAEALAVMDEPDAQAALDARWADPDPVIAQLAVAAALRRAPADAWRRFAPHAQAVLADVPTPHDETAIAALLAAVAAAARAAADAPADDLLAIEPRFLDLAARLRGHGSLGAAARAVLASVPLATAVGAIERYPRRGPRVTRGPLPSRRDFVARYRAGEHVVWDELVAHAAAITLHADLRAEAAAVADEVMRRVHDQALALGARACGPPADAAELARIVAVAGTLPLALAALWRICGALDLRPAAPLLLLSPGACEHAIAAYARRAAASHREIVGPLVLPALPPHALELPTAPLADGVDPVVRGAGLRLVPYLRAAFAAVPGAQPF